MPDELNICGMQYEIIEKDQVCKDELLNAQIDFMNGTICVDATMTDDRKRIALIHEVLHGICDAIGLYEIGENESAIQGLASSLYSTFKGSTIFS